CDNCPGVFNPRDDCDHDPATPPTQCDADGDGIGDACDPDFPGTNDLCANARKVGDGTSAFTTSSASGTDGPPVAASCGFGAVCDPGGSNICHDVWFRYVATCNGTVTASLCGSAFDSELVAYAGTACPVSDGNRLACNDDTCGTASQVSFQATQGNAYL